MLLEAFSMINVAAANSLEGTLSAGRITAAHLATVGLILRNPPEAHVWLVAPA